MSIVVKRDDNKEDFNLELNLPRTYVGLRLPLEYLKKLRGLMGEFIKTKAKAETETLRVSFFRESTEYFYIEYRPAKVHLSLHLDNAEVVEVALRRFSEEEAPIELKVRRE